eukprot:m.1411054 g.1411054  ORF g.1411054 m.1411054 type:complete len:75 (-) comp25028_c0_seq4:2132-2356(-)
MLRATVRALSRSCPQSASSTMSQKAATKAGASMLCAAWMSGYVRPLQRATSGTDCVHYDMIPWHFVREMLLNVL